MSDLSAKKARTRADYPFHLEFTTRWFVSPSPPSLPHTICRYLFPIAASPHARQW